MKVKTQLRGQRGMILIAALMVIVGLLAIGMAVASRTFSSSQAVRRDYHDDRVFNVAEGGADYAQDWLQGELRVVPNPSQSQLDLMVHPSIPDFQYQELRIVKQPFLNDVIVTRGAQQNVYADIQPYEVISHAANQNASVEQTVRVMVNQESIGLYQYGIYYDGNLEMFPTFPLDYIGRIHTNGNLYIGSHNTLDIESYCTAAGHMYNEPLLDPTIHLNGKARFKDAAGHWSDFSYDSRDPDWVTRSLGDWDGRVQDSSHGATRLPFPLPTTSIPHDIIERGNAGDSPELIAHKYYYKAGLIILDGVARDSLGNPVTLPNGILTNNSVYDYREQHSMAMTTLDMGLLMTANKVPANHVIYISTSTSHGAIRILNASTLPMGGIVIATDNPCYVQGNYNNVLKKPSSILCDAFNVYSTNWLDENATKNLNKRIAFATTVNSCVVTGNKETSTSHYSGGAENLIRLHEKWVGHQLTYRGSLVCIWQSEQALGDFVNASYVEAQRDWAFDQDLLDPNFWPPDNLSATNVTRGSWKPY